MKERRERTMKEIMEDQSLDSAIAERFNMERHPEATVDGDDRWSRMDLFDIPDDELPGMWERADYMGGAE